MNPTFQRDLQVGFDLRMMGALKLQGPQLQQALQVEARQRFGAWPVREKGENDRVNRWKNR